MTPEMLDLDAYLNRIGHTGSRDVCLPVLRSLVARHSAAIAFENVDPVAGRVPALDLAALQRKLLHGGRGGYCYEQNTLFLAALRALGFNAAGLLARVRRGVPAGVDTARSHMLLRVDLPGGPYLADVGFGGLTPTAPLALRPDLEQPTPNETFRLRLADGEYLLQCRVGDDWEDVYRFTLQAERASDYEQANWFTATRPNAMFAGNLIVTLPAPGVRRTLFNRHFTERRTDGGRERRVLRSRSDYAAVLRGVFGLILADADLDAIMAVVERHDPDGPYGGNFS
jgi:N-hydroxyarylamine O-acetyltransferase